ncbi:MAG: hypothetical protein RDV48_23755 [Candidatus Eremiobacteraeota bacterium]|nr:hypothetical protein [Candidatus Eremiobacteraeota bacterium]
MGAIVKELEKEYEKKVVIVTLYGDNPSHAKAMRYLKINEVPSFRFINKQTEIVCQMASLDKSRIKQELDKIAK